MANYPLSDAQKQIMDLACPATTKGTYDNTVATHEKRSMAIGALGLGAVGAIGGPVGAGVGALAGLGLGYMYGNSKGESEGKILVALGVKQRDKECVSELKKTFEDMDMVRPKTKIAHSGAGYSHLDIPPPIGKQVVPPIDPPVVKPIMDR